MGILSTMRRSSAPLRVAAKRIWHANRITFSRDAIAERGILKSTSEETS